jgi:signal transduction histidine kinase/CheY-like chemotaxis protein
MVRRNVIWISLAAVLVVSGAFFFALGNTGSVKDDPLYTDFMASPIYVKGDFSESYASAADVGAVEWDYVFKDGSSDAVTMDRLYAYGAGEDPQGYFYPWRDKRVSDFTIYIPFMLDERQYASMFDTSAPTDPCLYLGGIGDNWEIFVNGEAVYRQVFKDGDRLSQHRSQRGVTVPFNRNLLHKGTNYIVFHIIGARDSSYTGLYYVSPYYLGDYGLISNRGADRMTIGFCSVYIFLGLYHILLYFIRRKDSYNFAYGVFSVLVAIYFFARSPAIYRLSEDTAVTQRIEYAALYLLTFAIGVFLEILNFGKLHRVTVAYGWFAAALVAASCAFSVYFSDALLSVWQVGGMAYLGYLIVYDVVYTFVKRVRMHAAAEREKGRQASALALFFADMRVTMLGNIFILLSILIGTAIFDLYDSMILHSGFALTRYSFLAFTLFMAFSLARRYATNVEATEEMNELLEDTVRRRTQQLEEQKLIAEAASKAKGDFLANMSHEIRTPLNAVIGMTTIGAQSDDAARKDYAFGKIGEASTHLLGVINDILDMSKIEAGRLELSEVPFDVRGVVARVGDVMRFRTDEKRQRFSVEVADAVPRALFGDDLRLAQVMTNLIGNAVKFTSEGGEIGLRVELSSEAGGTYELLFAVSDTGIGISDEQKGNLFQSFGQADSSTSRNYGGTGLGLALSKQIVELMGGRIWVESEPGKGSVFSFTVKLPPADPSFEAADAGNTAVDALRDGEFAGRRVLLAEDVDLNREIVRALLERSGLEIVEAANGQIAVDLYERDPQGWDLILMDVQMPVLGGYEAADRIRASGLAGSLTIPIVAMTANVFREDVENSLAHGMDAHIGKPIDLDTLVSTLRRLMNPR